MDILFLGEANCSFALSLANLLLSHFNSPFPTKNPALTYLGLTETQLSHKITLHVTTFEPTITALSQKYHDIIPILTNLTTITSPHLTIKIQHGINAWELNSHFPDKKFNVVIWNHPHLGTEDFRLHRFLMAHFFKSAESVVDSNGIIAGRVILSLVSGQAERWSVFEQSRRSGLVVTERSRFQEELFVGYECKRNKTGQTFKNLNTKKWFGEMQSELLRFERVGEGDELSAELEKLKLNLGNTELAAHGSAQVVEEKSEKVISGMSKTLEVQIRKNRVKRPNVVGNFQCPHCEKKLTSTRSYTQHIHMVHELGLFNDKGEFICNQCAKKFSRQSDLEQHFISKHEKIDTDSLVSGNRPEIGGKILDFDNVESLGDDYEYYPCPDCGQSVIKQDWGMELHLETLKPAVGLGMTCPLCVKDYEEDKEGSIVKKMKTFCERRALFQHYKFCRVKHDKANITN